MKTELNAKPFVFDGAFGTYYQKISAKNVFCEYANLNEPDTVLKIHKQYINAGAMAIKTNTFGANSVLELPSDTIKNIIRNGYEIANQAVNNSDAIVFADIGYINSDNEDISKEYKSIAQTFIDLGAKYYLFETLAEYEVLLPAISHIKSSMPDSYIIVSFAATQDGYTKKGYYYKTLIDAASKNKDIDAVGLNCISGPSHFYNLIKELNISNMNFSAMPNAGYPSTINGRTVYQDNAEYFSDKLVDIYELGVNIIGGCCGTTPEHIKAVVEKVNEIKDSPKDMKKDEKKSNKIEVQKKNAFKEKMDSGKRIIAVELDPPNNVNCDYLITAAEKAYLAGADIITLADSPLARARADSIMLAAKIKRETDIEVLPHLSCRDRNYIGIKSALLGANIEDICNVLVVTGDPVVQTDRGNNKGVYNFNSYNLISYIKTLNTEIFSALPFFIGGALNINAYNFADELKRAEQKIQNGAEYLLTQPIFSLKAIENLKMAKASLNCKILAGILPVSGYKNALFLNNEVPGITIPEKIVDMLKDKTPKEAADISIGYCMDIIEKVKNDCDGYYIMTPLKKIDIVCDIINKIEK